MKRTISVIINNYNYGCFLSEAIDSVLSQTLKPNEIIIVDDGSSDKSHEILEKYQTVNTIKVIKKTNGGQLSAFNRGIAESTGYYIFLLDSDDRYAADYIEKAYSLLINNEDVDFLFSDPMKFGNEEGLFFQFKQKHYGFSMCRTYYSQNWIGSITSALVIKQNLAKKIFPLPDEDNWRICADTALIWFVSLVGGIKLQMPYLGVQYRIHADNLWANKPGKPKVYLILDIARVLRYSREKFGLDEHILELLLDKEFHSISKFDKDDLDTYKHILFQHTRYPYTRKIALLFKLYRRYVKHSILHKQLRKY